MSYDSVLTHWTEMFINDVRPLLVKSGWTVPEVPAARWILAVRQTQVAYLPYFYDADTASLEDVASFFGNIMTSRKIYVLEAIPSIPEDITWHFLMYGPGWTEDKISELKSQVKTPFAGDKVDVQTIEAFKKSFED